MQYLNFKYSVIILIWFAVVKPLFRKCERYLLVKECVVHLSLSQYCLLFCIYYLFFSFLVARCTAAERKKECNLIKRTRQKITITEQNVKQNVAIKVF